MLMQSSNLASRSLQDGLAVAREFDPLERFERVGRMVQRMFSVSIAALVTDGRDDEMFFAPTSSFRATLFRESVLWRQATNGDRVAVVPDASSVERYRTDPLVMGDAALRFFASHPLRDVLGKRLGTLILADRSPRYFSSSDLASLNDLAQTIELELSAARSATTDALTELLNRRGFMMNGRAALELCRRSDRSATLIYFDLDGLKRINDELGHQEGDRALAEFGKLLRRVFRSSDMLCRLGGDEFAVLACGVDSVSLAPTLTRLRHATQQRNLTPNLPFELQYSIGAITFDGKSHGSLQDLLHEADARMYADKQLRRKARAPSPARH